MQYNHSEETQAYFQRIPKSSPCVMPTKTKQIQRAFKPHADAGATRHHSKHTNEKLEPVYYDGNGYRKQSQLPLPLAPF